MKRWMFVLALGLVIVLPLAALATTSKNASMTHATHHTAMKVDLNTASKDDLMKLKGIDAATAERIIAMRPFQSKHDLVEKKIVTKHEYDAIASHISVTSEHAKK